MKVTKERIISTLMQSLIKAGQMDSPTQENLTTWINNVIQPVDDLIFDHYTQFSVPEPADEAVLREVTSKFVLLNGPWEQVLTRLNNRVERLSKLISIGAPKVTLENELSLVKKALVIVEEKVAEQ